MNASLTLTLTLAVALVAHVALKLWLNARQVRHVAAHRGAVPTAYAQTMGLADHQKAADYTLAKAKLSQIDIVLDAVVLVGWTLLGGLDALNQLLLGLMGPGMAQQIALIVSFMLIGGVIGLPLSLVQTFGVEQRFGFNKMTLGLWLADLAKGTLLGAVIGLPIAALILWLMGSAGEAWWLWAWGAWMGFNLLVLVLYPTVIAPLFNKFEPLADEALKSRVQALMARCGFAAKGLFVMDGSRRSAHANAYFTGFGAAKRVVFYDTLLAKLSPGEVDAVLAQGADLIMLPMFEDAATLRAFADIVGGRCPIVPLLETAGALRTLPEWLDTPGLWEVYVGLNDLHISMGLRFMFEPLALGLLDGLAAATRARGLRFGFGGIARLDEGLLPGRAVLGEHLRLGSQAVILSRTFHREDSDAVFEQEVHALREAERALALRDAAQVARDAQAARETIAQIAASIKPAPAAPFAGVSTSPASAAPFSAPVSPPAS